MSDTPLTDAIAHRGYQLDALATKAIDLARQLERENAALRADKERLDWLAVSDHWFDEPATESFNPETFRAAIDAARKEAQP